MARYSSVLLCLAAIVVASNCQDVDVGVATVNPYKGLQIGFVPNERREPLPYQGNQVSVNDISAVPVRRFNSLGPQAVEQDLEYDDDVVLFAQEVALGVPLATAAVEEVVVPAAPVSRQRQRFQSTSNRAVPQRQQVLLADEEDTEDEQQSFVVGGEDEGLPAAPVSRQRQRFQPASNRAVLQRQQVLLVDEEGTEDEQQSFVVGGEDERLPVIQLQIRPQVLIQPTRPAVASVQRTSPVRRGSTRQTSSSVQPRAVVFGRSDCDYGLGVPQVTPDTNTLLVGYRPCPQAARQLVQQQRAAAARAANSASNSAILVEEIDENVDEEGSRAEVIEVIVPSRAASLQVSRPRLTFSSADLSPSSNTASSRSSRLSLSSSGRSSLGGSRTTAARVGGTSTAARIGGTSRLSFSTSSSPSNRLTSSSSSSIRRTSSPSSSASLSSSSSSSSTQSVRQSVFSRSRSSGSSRNSVSSRSSATSSSTRGSSGRRQVTRPRQVSSSGSGEKVGRLVFVKYDDGTIVQADRFGRV